MSGSILGKDQVEKINVIYPSLLAHIRELLGKDNSAYGLMKVHVQVESLDSTALHTIFSTLSFLSPAEKKALVRAAVYEVLLTNTDLFKTTQIVVPAETIIKQQNIASQGEIKVSTYNPPAFKLNAVTVSSLKEEHK